MKSPPFNICPTCIHIHNCVLTDQKSQVWSCSEYDEKQDDSSHESEFHPELKSVAQPELILA